MSEYIANARQGKLMALEIMRRLHARRDEVDASWVHIGNHMGCNAQKAYRRSQGAQKVSTAWAMGLCTALGMRWAPQIDVPCHALPKLVGQSHVKNWWLAEKMGITPVESSRQRLALRNGTSALSTFLRHFAVWSMYDSATMDLVPRYSFDANAWAER